jgi:hypothetical protein
MKKSTYKKFGWIAVLILGIGTITSCSDDDENTNELTPNNPITGELINDQDKSALLFMLEEEKLARDTYFYLDSVWSINQFSNIKYSEQDHMNSIEGLLKSYDIPYHIESMGVFQDTTLQQFYNQFITDGVQSKINALTIGATIEDLDIVDLRERISQTINQNVIDVFQLLECGSNNHLRSFEKALTKEGGTYSPQYLTQSEYDIIINGTNAPCN